MTFTLAIVGRPNVGKSTLFNRLCRKKLAIIDDRPGVTRDWRAGEGDLYGQPITVMDTAGLEDRFDGSIESRMRVQTEQAITRADAILFVIDGREGVTPMDRHFAEELRRVGKPVILGMNKCDHEKISDVACGEAYGLGLGDPVALSAAHNIGFDALYHALTPYFSKEEVEDDVADSTFVNEDVRHAEDIALDEIEGREDFDFTGGKDIDDGKPIKIAIVGRPNGGKSTLMNALLGEDRVMTGPEAGITRDAISADYEFQGRKVRLVDTAGLRKRGRVVDMIERMSTDDTMRAIRLAQVVILVIDATLGPETQDMKIANHVIEEGRVLIFALNKWDAVIDRAVARTEMIDKLERSLGQLPHVPVVQISAEHRTNLDVLMRQVVIHYDGWLKRIPTAGLNRWVGQAVSRHPPALVHGRPNVIKYMTQIKVKPPTFAVWCGYPDAMTNAYQRYLINALREQFDLPPVPIRLTFRKTKNPFAS